MQPREQRACRLIRAAFVAGVPAMVLVAFLNTRHAESAGRDVFSEAVELGLIYVIGLVVGLTLTRRMKSHPVVRVYWRHAVICFGALYGWFLAQQSHDPSYALWFGIPSFLMILLVP